MRFRVLWIDAAGDGRFTTVEAASSEAAAWQVAMISDSKVATFEAIERTDPLDHHHEDRP
jgi:hypothetical protein